MRFVDFMNASALRADAAKLGFRINARRGTVGNKALTAPQGPLNGAFAEIISETADRRVSATRVAAGAVVGLGVGAIVGALAKKQAGKVRIRITDGNGGIHSAQVPAKEYDRAERFCNRFNARYRGETQG